MSVIPFDIHDRESLQDTLDDMKTAISKGDVSGYVVIALNKDGTCAHGHNADINDFPALIGWLDIKKQDLINRYE